MPGVRPLRRLGLLLLIVSQTSAAGAHWTDHAKKLIGEPEEVTKHSIAQLRKDRELPAKLKKALGSKNHFLALDVVASLGMKTMIPTLLAFAVRDRTGYSYHALNALIEEKDFQKIGEIYRERLRKPKTAFAAKMAMLDTLGRIGTEIDLELLHSLLVQDEPEVRSSAIYYIRTSILRRRRQELYPLLKSAISDPAFQNRLQTLYLISELPAAEREERKDLFTSIYQICAKDPHPQVKTLCGELQK